MDILSHGLWGSLAFGRKNRRSFWMSFWWGIFPDLISFGFFFGGVALGFFDHPPFGGGHPPSWEIPRIIHILYNWSHSLVIFGAVFALVLFFLKRVPYEMLAWPTHIVFDIFTHTKDFFPTPFLWPISDYSVSLINWNDPRIFIPNVILLALLVFWFFVVWPRLRKRYHSR